MAGARLLLAGHLVQGGKAQLAGEHRVQGNGRGDEDQKRRHRTDQQDHLLHIQAHHRHHQHGDQHATGQRRNGELLFQQGPTASKHHHGDREHEEGDQQVD
ncbi:hypothetical protein D3C80_956780 [compost metagenome]